MANTSFDEFVRREQQEPLNWQAEKTAWLRHLEELYTQVEGYLKPYRAAGQVNWEYRPVTLNEEYIGSYSTREMIITIGSKTVKLEPIGAIILGSKGRVDVVGPWARAQLLLLDSKVRSTSDLISSSVVIDRGLAAPRRRRSPFHKWVWRIVTRPPRGEVIEINKDNFLNLLVEISNGQNI